MKSQCVGVVAVLMVLVFAAVLIAPPASADQGSVVLDNGQSFSRQVKMDQGRTMYAKYESNYPLVFMVIDPNGNVIRYYNSTYEGEFIDAKVGGDYTLVWQSTNPASTVLTYDYTSDVMGFNDPLVQMVIIGAIVVIAAVAIYIWVRRKKNKNAV